MAFTYVVKKSGVEGDKKYQIVECTFTAVTSGYFPTGFSNVLFASANNEVTEGDGLLKKNIATDGSTVEYGGIYLSGFTASDVATVKVEGI